MRALVGIAVAAAFAVALGVWLLRTEPAEAFPDLDQAVPTAVELRREGSRDLIVFASAVDNVGAGPLVLEAKRPDPETPTMAVDQLVSRHGADPRAEPVDAVLRYEQAETHAHWHLLGFESYELRSTEGALVVAARKAGFCLGDRYDSRGSVRLDGEPEQAVWTDECGKDQPELLRLSEGISVGHGDDYAPYLEGQYVDVTRLDAGRYVLVHIANPDRVLRESDYENNAASVLLDLERDAGDRLDLQVVARCPDTAVCTP